MPPTPHPSGEAPDLPSSPARAWAAPARFWLALALLTWLQFLPRLVYWHDKLHGSPLRRGHGAWASLLWRTGQDPFFVQGELWLAATLLAVVAARRTLGPWMVRALGLLWATLFIYELNTVFGLVFMTQEPLFYDELFLLKHLLRLIGDLWRPSFLLWGLAGLTAVGLLAAVVRRLLSMLVTGTRDLGRGSATLLAAVWLLTSVAMVRHGIDNHQVEVRWASPGIAANLAESARVFAQVHRQVADSPYRALDAVQLRRKPDVHVIIVESYGQVVATIPALRQTWEPRIRDMQDELAARGWHMATAWCRSPISGGRSWLADASMLLGVRIFHQSVYEHLLDQPDPVNLVRWFRGQDYRTVIVAPADRARPGIQLENLHHFDTTVFQKDLHYEGPPMGWGIVPDQYALEYAHEEVLDRIDQPVFSWFHGTTSHVPWQDIPPLVEDWRSLGTLPGDPVAADEALDDMVKLQLKRFRSRPLKDTPGYQGEALPQQQGPYRDAIDYDLGVVQAHLDHLDDDALVVVLGDHQPPWMNRYQQSYAVPLHLFSKDPALLDEFLDQGFSPGLVPPDDAPVAIKHEGFFSLLVRNLARCCSDDPLPAYLPDGAGGRAADPR